MFELTLKLNNPLTEEQWDSLTDVDFDHTNEIMFYTKHGKEVHFVKKQELSPRVLTLDELKKAPSGSVLWTEWKPIESSVYPVEFLSIYSHTFPDGVTDKVIEFAHGMDYEDMYGKQFRLWTAKPTEEQRKTVKWDE